MTTRRRPRRLRTTLARALAATATALLLTLPFATPASASNTWPYFPSDGEIQAAVDRVLAKLDWSGCGGGPQVDIHKITHTDMPASFPPNQRADVVVTYAATSPGDRQCDFVGMLVYGDGQWMFLGVQGAPSASSTDTPESYTAKLMDSMRWAPGWPPDAPGGPGEPGEPTAPTLTPPPELPFCVATISVPPDLAPGDTLSPSANVASEDGAPVQGEIATKWEIGGVAASSVTWDGTPVEIVLQLSCQGHAQEFRATYTGTLDQGSPPVAVESGGPSGGPSVEPTGSSEPSEPPESPVPSSGPAGSPAPSGRPHRAAAGPPPGLGGIGDVPGPADPVQGLLGVLAPALIGVLGAVLLGGAGGGGTGTPVAPGGPGGAGSPGGSGGSGGPGGPGPTGTSPGGDGITTQGAIDKLTYAMNQAVATNNTAMAEAVSNAQADLLDADGNVIPGKYAAAIKAIRAAAGLGAGLAGTGDFYDPNSGTDAALKAARDSWLGKKVDAGVGSVVSFASSAGHGISQIADALWNPRYFLKGLEAATQNVAPAESQAMDSALADGRYLDALGAGAMKYGKGYFAGYQAVGSVGVSMVTGMLPVDEIKTLMDPNTSMTDKFAAYQSAELKVGLLLAPFLGEVRGAAAAVDAAQAVEAANAAAKAGRAVEAAEAAGSAVRAGSAAEATTTAGTVARTRAAEAGAAEAVAGGRAAKAGAAEAGAAEAGAAEAKAAEATAGAVGPAKPPTLTPERLEATISAGKKVERLSATVLGDTVAPTNLREGARILRENPGLQEAADNAIRADGGSGAARMGRQVGDLNSNANNLITARKMDLQNQAMNNAAKRIAELEAKLCQAAGEPVPSRIPTFEVTQGNRGYISGANTSTDLDRTFQLRHVTTKQANDILAEECGKLGGPGKPGFSPDDLATHAYVAKPGTLVDASGDAPLSDSFVRGNLQQINSKSGYVPTYTAPDGAVTVGNHVDAGLGTEALPMPQRFGPTGAPASADAASAAARAAASSADVATQISKIDSAVAANNVNDCAKAAARAIKAGGHFVGPEEAIMRAAAAKDPIEATKILHQAGIDSLSDLRARIRP